MAALSPGCRNGVVHGISVQEDTPDDPTPIPVVHGPRNVAEMKQMVVDYQRAIARIQRHIQGVEFNLAALDPAAVVAVNVPFYTDPPERVDAARAARDAALVPTA